MAKERLEDWLAIRAALSIEDICEGGNPALRVGPLTMGEAGSGVPTPILAFPRVETQSTRKRTHSGCETGHKPGRVLERDATRLGLTLA